MDYHEEVKKLWENCMNLPMAVRNWHQFKELKDSINNYLQIFPILHKLASKEIRNRHWLQVMQVTKKSFQLEANIFKLNHILDIGLMEHREEIEDILQSSHAELELEVKLRHIAEEWSEQVNKEGLLVDMVKSLRGVPCQKKVFYCYAEELGKKPELLRKVYSCIRLQSQRTFWTR